jgi:hypothetical protein
MGVHRVRRYEQLFGNLAVRATLSDQVGDLSLGECE